MPLKVSNENKGKIMNVRKKVAALKVSLHYDTEKYYWQGCNEIKHLPMDILWAGNKMHKKYKYIEIFYPQVHYDRELFKHI